MGCKAPLERGHEGANLENGGQGSLWDLVLGLRQGQPGRSLLDFVEHTQREEHRRALAALADTFEASVGGVVQTVTSAVVQLQGSSHQMASTATQTSSQATSVASA